VWRDERTLRPSLDELARDPARVALLPPDQRAVLLNDLVGLFFAFGAASGGGADRLLPVKEAGYKLGCAPDTLYKSKRHPARVQNGRSVRFSEKAIEAVIRRQLRAQG
jgi:predicted DNA-binding transcriptional regulator AlpA